MSQLTLRVISRLLSYPTEALQAAVAEMLEVLELVAPLPDTQRRALADFLRSIGATPLLELQERYVATFDRGRNLSLHLFEHVHGESRDRGQAMVDLMNHYRAHGYALGVRELPDHLPLMLEFLSTQSREAAAGLLDDALPVIVLLAARLREAGSAYAVLFDAVEALGGTPAGAAALRRQAAGEGPDETLVKMDEIWAEEQVTFLAGSDPAGNGCTARRAGRPAAVEIPIHWTDLRPQRQTRPEPKRR